MREGKLVEALESVQHLSDNPFYERKFLGACLQGSSGSDFDRLSRDVESTILVIPDPEPLYYAGADLVFCRQSTIGWRMIENGIQKNYCAFEALQNDPLLVNSKQTPEFRKALSDAKACKDKFLLERNRNGSSE